MKPVEILLYSEVWFGDAEKFVTAIRAAGSAPILFRINSPGGSVFDGYAIYNALLAHKADVTVQIDGMAASIASLIAMAGKKIIFASNAMMMIHNPTMGGGGDANELRKKANLLDEIKSSCVSAYKRRIGDKLTVEQLNAMLDAETWFTAEDAQKLGMCDEIIAAADAKNLAAFDTSKFRNPPPQLKLTMTFKLTASIATLLATASGLTITENTSEADVTAAINKLTSDATALKGKVTAAEGQVTALTTERDGIKSQFDALTLAANDHKAKLTTAEGQVTALTTERDGVKAQLATASGSITRLEQLCAVKGLDPKSAPPKVEDPQADNLTEAQWEAKLQAASTAAAQKAVMAEFQKAVAEGRIK